ncbi:PAS domain S-box protein [Candidatus Binatus sp.]|uniref:PAS domain-containing hybrid sensor histidine kinase/response regulator n=1 Tax=Candidatus Binatus sp. TaxID=2811406 RepID=UPI003C91459F
MSDLRFLDEYATDFRALDLLESMWIPAPARDWKDYRMGETPKQHDIASRERSLEHDQLKVAASTSGEQPRSPSRNTLSDSQVADEKFVGLLRTGTVLIVFFQLVYAAEHRFTSPSTFDATLSLHLINIAIGVMSFLLTFTRAMPRYWRQIAVFVCSALLVSTTAICADSMRIEPLFVSTLVIVVGGGMLVPWDWGWQAAIGTVGMVCFYMLGRAHGVVDSDPSMHWLGLITAVGLAQSNVGLQTKNRRALAQNLADRLSSDQKLTDSEQKFRQIFEQSGDMVVVTNLDTSAILEVNNQFVARSRVPRELVLGRREVDFNFFADPRARDQFMKELQETGVVKNLEVELNGVGYARPMTALISAVAVRLNNQPCAIIVVREISDVKEAERKLRNSEATLRKIFDKNLDSVTTTDALTRCYTDVNQEFSRATGFSREEVLGKTYWEVGVWPSREESDNFSAAMIRSGEVRNMRANFYAKNGTRIPCLMSGAMVELDGKLSVLTITRNIGDLLAAERKLKESEVSLRKIFDSILDPVSITDLDGRFVDVNDEFMRLSEYSRAEIIGQVSDNETAVAYTESLRTNRQVRNFEVTISAKSGVQIPVLLSSVVVELGGEERVVTIARDITRLKEQERKLQSSEAMLREIFDASVDNIALTDLNDGIIIDVNHELVRSLGLAKGEIVGKRFDQLKVWEDSGRLALFTATLLERREVRNFETIFRTAGGSTFPALISAVVLELGGRECALSIARDITDLEAARQKALAASKAKTEFLSSMSHEIRTPMNAILGMADLIGESDLNSEQRRYLDTILSNGNALLELINSILDLARVESGRMNLEAVAFDVIELTEKVADTLAVRAHEKGIELAVRFSGDLPPTLVGDSLRLRQVLTNLIGNAIKFTERGEVAVDVAHNPGQSNPGSLLFSVRDSGIGMPAQTLSNIFSAFTQADSSTTRKYGGSGLGLAIVERLVALMGGRVWAESELGAGSTFHFTVELALLPANESKTQQHRGLDLSSVRVLVVDDNATNRSIVRQKMRAAGAVVTEATSGAEGLAAFAAANLNGAPFGLLLIDLQMPAMDGFEMIRRMRGGANGNAPIVMLVTSSGLTDRLNAMRELGLNYYVVKPVKSRELYAAISDAMAQVVAPAKVAPEPAHEVAANGSGAHLLDRPLDILLADDSADNRLLIAAYLKKSGYVLDQVEDGQAALERFMTRAYDVVLMDIQMPVLDGYGAVRKIREWETANERGRTPIIALSASALETDVRHAIEVGCDLHVSKPVKKSTLLKAIAEVVENFGHDGTAAKPSSSGDDSTSVQQ